MLGAYAGRPSAARVGSVRPKSLRAGARADEAASTTPAPRRGCRRDRARRSGVTSESVTMSYPALNAARRPQDRRSRTGCRDPHGARARSAGRSNATPKPAITSVIGRFVAIATAPASATTMSIGNTHDARRVALHDEPELGHSALRTTVNAGSPTESGIWFATLVLTSRRGRLTMGSIASRSSESWSSPRTSWSCVSLTAARKTCLELTACRSPPWSRAPARSGRALSRGCALMSSSAKRTRRRRAPRRAGRSRRRGR